MLQRVTIGLRVWLLEALVALNLLLGLRVDLTLQAVIDRAGGLAGRRVLVIEEMSNQRAPLFQDNGQRAGP